MRLLVGLTCSHNIVQRIPSVSWHMASWWGSWVLSMWAIKNARKRSRKENQITLLVPRSDFPTFLPHSYHRNWHTIHIDSMERKYTKLWPPTFGIIENISDPAPFWPQPTTVLIFTMTLCSKQFKTQILSFYFPAYSQIHPTTSAKLPWTQTTIWFKPLPLATSVDLSTASGHAVLSRSLASDTLGEPLHQHQHNLQPFHGKM